MEKGTCKHFRGLRAASCGEPSSCGEPCDAGVDVRAITGGPDLGWGIRIPCHERIEVRDGKPVERATCDRYEEPTAEEIAAEEAEWERIAAEVERRMRVVEPLVRRLKRENKGRSNSGVEECPCCKGRMHWRIAGYNGHVHMKCETEGCIAFME